MIKKILTTLLVIGLSGCTQLATVSPDEPPAGTTWNYESNIDDGYQLEYVGQSEKGGHLVHEFSRNGGSSDIVEIFYLRGSDGARFNQAQDSDNGIFIPFMHWGKTSKQPFFKDPFSENLWISTNLQDIDGRRIVHQTEYYGPPEINGTKANVMSIEYRHGALLPEKISGKLGRVSGNQIIYALEVKEVLMPEKSG